jgi:hypothetical protein
LRKTLFALAILPAVFLPACGSDASETASLSETTAASSTTSAPNSAASTSSSRAPVYTAPTTAPRTTTARPTSPSASVADSLFVQAADEYGVQYNSRSEIIGLGHMICQQLDSGTDPWDLATRFVSEADWTSPAAGAMVGSAIAVYCPEHEDKM